MSAGPLESGDTETEAPTLGETSRKSSPDPADGGETLLEKRERSPLGGSSWLPPSSLLQGSSAGFFAVFGAPELLGLVLLLQSTDSSETG